MIKILSGSIIAMIFMIFGCSQEQQKEVDVLPQENEVIKTIVAVGDSLTAGFGLDETDSYPLLLGQKLRAAGMNYQVINAGVSGETSSGTLSRMEWILTLDPDIVILEIGANDGLRGIDPFVAEENMRQMLQLLKDRDIAVLFAGMKMVQNLGTSYVSQFDRIYPALAKEFDVVFFPFFLEGNAMIPELNQSDGVHPNAKGYAVIVDNIYPYVIEVIQKRKSS